MEPGVPIDEQRNPGPASQPISVHKESLNDNERVQVPETHDPSPESIVLVLNTVAALVGHRKGKRGILGIKSTLHVDCVRTVVGNGDLDPGIYTSDLVDPD